jgi:hypothetical protein
MDPLELTPGVICRDREGGKAAIDADDGRDCDVGVTSRGVELLGCQVEGHSPTAIKST